MVSIIVKEASSETTFHNNSDFIALTTRAVATPSHRALTYNSVRCYTQLLQQQTRDRQYKHDIHFQLTVTYKFFFFHHRGYKNSIMECWLVGTCSGTYAKLLHRATNSVASPAAILSTQSLLRKLYTILLVYFSGYVFNHNRVLAWRYPFQTRYRWVFYTVPNFNMHCQHRPFLCNSSLF